MLRTLRIRTKVPRNNMLPVPRNNMLPVTALLSSSANPASPQHQQHTHEKHVPKKKHLSNTSATSATTISKEFSNSIAGLIPALAIEKHTSGAVIPEIYEQAHRVSCSMRYLPYTRITACPGKNLCHWPTLSPKSQCHHTGNSFRMRNSNFVVLSSISSWRGTAGNGSLFACIRSFSSCAGNDHSSSDDTKLKETKGSLTEDGDVPCYGQLSVMPTTKGYKVEIVIRRHQQRNFSQSSTSNNNKDSENSEDCVQDPVQTQETGDKATKEAQRRERRRRLTVLYPFNDQDILRKQRIRKEQKLARTVANVKRALLGNLVIAGSKLFAWFCSQSSSMMSEFIHSVVDCANQYLLLHGLRDSSNIPDRKHPYGYGKSVYFWALVSALGTFFMGFGVSLSHAWGELMNPSLHDIGPEVLGVLAFSFCVDGWVLHKTIREIRGELPKGLSFFAYVKTMRDPATLAILLEDGAACFGVLLAIAGTACSHATGNPIYDGLAGCSISFLLGSMGFTLASVNYRFLLGQAVDKEITDSIEKILKSRRSIDYVTSVQSQWTGPDTFSYKAEVGFDGTFLAAKLMPTHEKEFLAIRNTMEQELQLVLSWYAEDVIRTVEREVRILEAQVRKRYPGAEYIELEPMSKDSHEFAIDDNFEQELRRAESETLENLRKLMPSLDKIDAESRPSGAPISPQDSDQDVTKR